MPKSPAAIVIIAMYLIVFSVIMMFFVDKHASATFNYSFSCIRLNFNLPPCSFQMISLFFTTFRSLAQWRILNRLLSI
jgi:hypothetical protein